MKKWKTCRVLMVLAAAAGTALPAAADASIPGDRESVSVTVDYSDLNVDSVSGALELYSRLQRATRKACDVQSIRAIGSIRGYALTRACYHDALESAVRRIDNDTLNDVHNG